MTELVNANILAQLRRIQEEIKILGMEELKILGIDPNLESEYNLRAPFEGRPKYKYEMDRVVKLFIDKGLANSREEVIYKAIKALVKEQMRQEKAEETTTNPD